MTQPIPRIITLQALTFLHPGTGQTTGVIDLPIQREVHSGHPMYASSGLKGSLRDKAEQKWKANNPELVLALFGSEAGDDAGKTTAGAVAITDGRIFAFPVRSLQKVFVWVTCPLVINRFLRDAKLINLPFNDLTKIDHGPGENGAWVNSEADFSESEPLILEEISFSSVTDQDEILKKVADTIKELTGDTGFDPKRLVMIPDNDFSYFVEHATQVSARIKLNERKTTTGGGGNLWYEEALPPETILYGFALCHKPRSNSNGINDAAAVEKKLHELCSDNYLQIGGNETVGQGWCHVNLYRGMRNESNT